MILEIIEPGISALDIIKWVGGSFGTILILLLIYSIKMLFDRIRRLEREASLQMVKNQSFSDFQKYKDVSDSEFKKIVENLVEKLGEKIDGLSSEIHDMKIEIVQITASK